MSTQQNELEKQLPLSDTDRKFLDQVNIIKKMKKLDVVTRESLNGLFQPDLIEKYFMLNERLAKLQKQKQESDVHKLTERQKIEAALMLNAEITKKQASAPTDTIDTAMSKSIKEGAEKRRAQMDGQSTNPVMRKSIKEGAETVRAQVDGRPRPSEPAQAPELIQQDGSKFNAVAPNNISIQLADLLKGLEPNFSDGNILDANYTLSSSLASSISPAHAGSTLENGSAMEIESPTVRAEKAAKERLKQIKHERSKPSYRTKIIESAVLGLMHREEMLTSEHHEYTEKQMLEVEYAIALRQANEINNVIKSLSLLRKFFLHNAITIAKKLPGHVLGFYEKEKEKAMALQVTVSSLPSKNPLDSAPHSPNADEATTVENRIMFSSKGGGSLTTV